MLRWLLQSIFKITKVGKLLGKITDPMIIIIRVVVGFMARSF